MEITFSEVVVWMIVGALAGSLAGMLMKRRKEGFGHVTNLGIGLVGALVGGLILKALQIELPWLAAITISLKDLVVAFVGSVIFLAVVWLIQTWWKEGKVKKI